MMEVQELIPVSFLNAFVYCPRRFYLEYVRGMFEDNAHTIEGRSRHHVVDMRGKEARPGIKEDVIHRRSVSFSSVGLGIIGKLDLVEEKEGLPAYPVEYKKAKKPKSMEPWLNDRIQLCAQGLLMQENGLPFPEKGSLYYIASRARVEVLFSRELVEETKKVIAQCREVAAVDEIPELAGNRNKCFGCSLNAICLPEEEEVLEGRKTNARRILPSGLEGDVLYVDTIGAYLGLSGESIKITGPGGVEIGQASLEKLREVVLCGPVHATSQVVHACLHREIPVHYMNLHGRYLGMATPMLHYHGLLREAQWKAHFDSHKCLGLSKEVVKAKIANMRTIMMRYLGEERAETDEANLRAMKAFRRMADEAEDADKLRGYEGIAGRAYFSGFQRYVKQDRRTFFFFKDRNRRPPKDPVNALLSFGSASLPKTARGPESVWVLIPIAGSITP
jgi:CRISPR-associated protein Cas1